MEFGEKLRKAREARGLTQQTLANELYVTRQAVSRWECGARFPDLMTAKKISEFLDVSLDELLSREETCRCMEETPVLDSPHTAGLQSALYGFSAMGYFLTVIFSLHLLPSEHFIIKEIINNPLNFSGLFTDWAMLFLMFYGLFLSFKGRLSPRKTALLPILYAAARMANYLYPLFLMRDYPQTLIRRCLLFADGFLLPLMLILTLVQFFFRHRQNYRIGIYLIFTYNMLSTTLSYLLARTAPLETELGFFFGTLSQLSYYAFVGLVIYQTHQLYKKRIATSA